MSYQIRTTLAPPNSVHLNSYTAWKVDGVITIINLDTGERDRGDLTTHRLLYSLVQAESKVTIEATTKGASWLINIAPSTFADFVPGSAWWQAIAVDSQNREQVIESGYLTLLADLTSVSNFDGRSTAQRTLEQVESAIVSLQGGTVESYTIGRRTLTYRNIPELLEWRSRLKHEVRRERLKERNLDKIGIEITSIR